MLVDQDNLDVQNVLELSINLLDKEKLVPCVNPDGFYLTENVLNVILVDVKPAALQELLVKLVLLENIQFKEGVTIVNLDMMDVVNVY